VYVVRVMCALRGVCTSVCARRVRRGAPREHNIVMKAQPSLVMSQLLLQQRRAPGT
jgi:hypothetical protein